MRQKPKVALLWGSLLSPFQTQFTRSLERFFDFTAFTPHRTRFDLTGMDLPRQSLWCPLEAGRPFQDFIRNGRAFQDRFLGGADSYCGLADRLRGFDILHVMDQYYCYSMEAALAKRRWGSRMVVTQWENIPHLNEGKFFSRTTKGVLRKEADLFLAMSQGAKHALLSEGVPEERIRRVFGSVDTAHFRPGPAHRDLQKKLGFTRDHQIVLYVGRLARDKGISTLIRSVEALKDRHPNLRCLCVGRDEEGIAAEVVRRGLSGIVKLVGPTPYKDMPYFYRLASLFVLPSIDRKGWKEQFGYVLAEAMACGVPVLGSDSGAIPEVVGDPARVFPQGDSTALTALIERFLKAPRQPQTDKARKRALRFFSNRVFAASLKRFYDRLLKSPR